MSEPAGAAAARPLLSVVRGQPSPEHVAALVAVLATRGGPSAAAPPARSAWRSPLRAALPPPGPAAWRESALPH